MKNCYRILAIVGALLLCALPFYYLLWDQGSAPVAFWIPYIIILSVEILIIRQLKRLS